MAEGDPELLGLGQTDPLVEPGPAALLEALEDAAVDLHHGDGRAHGPACAARQGLLGIGKAHARPPGQVAAGICQARIGERDPLAVLGDPALPGVCADLAALTRQRFANAAAALDKCARGPMRPASAMMEVYRRILDRLEARGWTDLDERVRLSKPEKLWIAFRHGVF